MAKELQINNWRSWDIRETGFFISKTDDSGTIWVGVDSLKDLKELIKRTEEKLKKLSGFETKS